MARHTGNTKAHFRDAVDKPKLDRPQIGDPRVKKAKRGQKMQKLTPEERRKLLEEEVADLDHVEFSPTKRACRTKRNAENKIINASSGAEQALLDKQKGPSRGMKQTGSADQENIYSSHVPLPQIEQTPVDPWILPISENTLIDPIAWHQHALEITEDRIKPGVELENFRHQLQMWEAEALSQTADLDEAKRLQANEVYSLLSPEDRKLVNHEAVLTSKAYDLTSEESQKRKKVASLVSSNEVRGEGFDDGLQRRVLNEIAALESQLTKYPPKALSLTDQYQKWCDANGLEMRQLIKGSNSTMSNAIRYALNPEQAVRDAHRQERRAKKAKQRRKSADVAPERVAEAQNSTKADTEEVVIECKSTHSEPRRDDHRDAVSEVEKVVAEEAPQVEEKPSQPEVSEESTSHETGADELPEAATTSPTASEQAASDGTYTDGKQSSNKRSAATADLDDEKLPQDLQESKKPKLSVGDQEDEQEDSQQVGPIAPPPPPAQSVTRITLATYSQRHNLQPISPLEKQQREDAAKKKMEEDRKLEWESMTPEEQEMERQNREWLEDEAKSLYLTGDAQKEHTDKMNAKTAELYRRAMRDAGLTVKGIKSVYDPELDERLSAEDKLKGKPRFRHFEHHPYSNVALSDPRLANPSYRRGTMGKGKAMLRPEPYNLPVWSSDENDVVEMVEEPVAAKVEEQYTLEVVEKVEKLLAPVDQKSGGEVAEKIEEQVIDTVATQSALEVIEKAEKQSDAVVVKEGEVQSAAKTVKEVDDQLHARATPSAAPPSTAAPPVASTPTPARASAPAPTTTPAATGAFFSSLLKMIPETSVEASTTQSSTDSTTQQIDNHGSAVARAERPGKATPMSSAIHAAYQSFD